MVELYKCSLLLSSHSRKANGWGHLQITFPKSVVTLQASSVVGWCDNMELAHWCSLVPKNHSQALNSEKRFCKFQNFFLTATLGLLLRLSKMFSRLGFWVQSSRYLTSASVDFSELVFRFVTEKDSLLHHAPLFLIFPELPVALTALGL